MSFILLLLTIISAFSWSRLIFTQKEASIRFIPMHLFVGILIMSFFYLIKEYVGLDTWSIYIIVLLPIIFLLIKVPISKWLSFSKLKLTIVSVISILIGVVVIGSSFVHLISMAGGDYPEVIYNVDAAYYMQFVHGFVLENKYPPDFRLSINEGFNYHYATVAAAGLISEFTSFSAHNAFLVIIPLIGILGFYFIASLVFETAGVAKKYAFIFGGILLLGYSQYLIPYWRPTDAVRVIQGGGRFLDQFMQMPTLYGLTLVLLTIYLLFNFSNIRYKVIIVLCLLLIPVVKMPYAPAVGIIIGMVSLYYFIKLKDKSAIMVPVLGVMVMVVSYVLFVKNDFIGAAFGVKPLGLFDFNALFTLGYFFIVIGMSILVNGIKSFKTLIPDTFYLIVIPLLVVLSLVYFDHRDAPQLTPPLILSVSFFAILIAYKALFYTNKKLVKYLIVAVLLFTALPAYLVTAKYNAKVLSNPTLGGEYCNNKSVGDILQQIPVEGTLLVINDTRYPADNYVRVDRQFQISALYGHYAFNAEMLYSIDIIDNVEDRVDITKLLQSSEWDNEAIQTIVNKHNITHYLMHKTYNHADNIPATLVAENEEYALYELK